MTENFESPRQTTEILKRVIHFIGHHQLSASPVNYSVCYEYFRGEHLLLNQAVDKALESPKPISSETMQNWFDTFLLGYDLKELNQSQTKLSEIATQLTSVTNHAEDNVEKFDNSLNDCKNELNDSASNSSVSSVVSLLLSSTTSMQIAMEQMKQQINESKQEISSLQDRLEIATVEALTDPLTGLTNRKGLSMAIEESLSSLEEQSSEYPCLLMLDIDHFKKINDSFGHLLGDKAIKLVADTLKKQIKGKDTAARYGGEEFAILLPETELQNARTVAEKIRQVIESMSIKRKTDNKEICRMTISIGVSRYQPGDTISSFIESADTALYQSKNSGRNKVSVFEA